MKFEELTLLEQTWFEKNRFGSDFTLFCVAAESVSFRTGRDLKNVVEDLKNLKNERNTQEIRTLRKRGCVGVLFNKARLTCAADPDRTSFTIIGEAKESNGWMVALVPKGSDWDVVENGEYCCGYAEEIRYHDILPNGDPMFRVAISVSPEDYLSSFIDLTAKVGEIDIDDVMSTNAIDGLRYVL